MRTVIALVVAGLSVCAQSSEHPPMQRTVVLPSPELLRCVGPSCQQVWHPIADSNAIYPQQVAIDFDNGCIYGLAAHYDPGTSAESIKAAINSSFKQWEIIGKDESDRGVWRVEPMKFAISLSTADKKDAKLLHEDVGTKDVLYIAFGGKSACATH
jgi:hypothetical protein